MCHGKCVSRYFLQGKGTIFKQNAQPLLKLSCRTFSHTLILVCKLNKRAIYSHWTSTKTPRSLVPVPTWFDNSQTYNPLSSLVAFLTNNAVSSGLPPSNRDWFKLRTVLFCSHLTLCNETGLASYSQNRRNSPVSLTVNSSGLTYTRGGSMRWKINWFNFKLGNSLQVHSLPNEPFSMKKVVEWVFCVHSIWNWWGPFL